MFLYIILFISIAILALSNRRPSKLLFFSIMMVMGLFVGLSDMLGGYDRYVYGEVFDVIAYKVHNRILDSESFNFYFGHELAYGWWNILIGLVSGNRYFFILITTLLIYALYAFIFYRNSKHPYFSLLIFLGMTFFFTFTYLRQIIAMGLVWTAIPYAIQKEKWKFLGFVVLAALFHNSAALFILFYFIPLRRFSSNRIILFMSGLLILGLTNITGTLFGAYGGVVSAAADKAAAYKQTSNNGFRIEYLLEAILFLYIFIKNYKRIEGTPQNYAMMNLYLMFCGILFFFVRSSDGGRLAWYGAAGIILLLPQLCSASKKSNLKMIMVIMFAALYLRILLSWGILLSPYKTFLTSGVREGDVIYDINEYNTSYDNDKFQNFIW